MCTEKANIQKIVNILELNLTIPDYQRPYKWQVRHVQQLLNDLFRHFSEDKIYRIGTIVLHSHENKLEIVDGQQRLITLTLLLNKLHHSPLSLLSQELNHSISHNNIKQNDQFIEHFVKENPADKEDFKKYLLAECEMVVVTLTDLDEAFQFFDSQNARGKPLETYDLLKAYHLREMQTKPESEIHRCVEDWEHAALADERDPNLHKIINQILFRLRRWPYQESGEQFTTQELDCFKGVSENCNYPYLHQIQAAYALFQAASVNPLYQRQFAEPMFQTNQPMINGVHFFDYIQHYRRLYTKLFDTQTGLLTQIHKINDVKLDTNLLYFLDTYQHHTRTGDRYLRNLFECLVLAYYDKFGDEGLIRAVNKILLWVYRIRFESQRILFITVEKAAWQADGLAVCIERALTPDAVMRFINPPLKTNSVSVKVAEKFKEIFNIKGADNDSKK